VEIFCERIANSLFLLDSSGLNLLDAGGATRSGARLGTGGTAHYGLAVGGAAWWIARLAAGGAGHSGHDAGGVARWGTGRPALVVLALPVGRQRLLHAELAGRRWERGRPTLDPVAEGPAVATSISPTYVVASFFVEPAR